VTSGRGRRRGAPKVPRNGDKAWCVINFAGNRRWGLSGNLTSFEILEYPKNGLFQHSSTQIAYKGLRLGHDRLVVKKHWTGPMHNEPMSGTQIFDIEVVDHL